MWPGHQVMMKTDESMEKMKTCENKSFRHESDSGGVEYGQRNGERNFNIFGHEKSVC